MEGLKEELRVMEERKEEEIEQRKEKKLVKEAHKKATLLKSLDDFDD